EIGQRRLSVLYLLHELRVRGVDLPHTRLVRVDADVPDLHRVGRALECPGPDWHGQGEADGDETNDAVHATVLPGITCPSPPSSRFPGVGPLSRRRLFRGHLACSPRVDSTAGQVSNYETVKVLLLSCVIPCAARPESSSPDGGTGRTRVNQSTRVNMVSRCSLVSTADPRLRRRDHGLPACNHRWPRNR